MALNAKKALAASKSYTDEVVAGGGTIKGKNCTIDSIVPIAPTQTTPGGQRVTFKWTLDTGVEQTSIMDVFNGVDGQGIDRMYVDNDSHLIVVYDDGTEEDCGEITVPMAQSDWDETDPSENSYIKNKPTIPAAQVNSDWNASSGVAEILNKPNIPTKVSDLQNDSGFEANTIESISVNGTAVTPDANKNVNIVVQGGGGTSDYSDLTNKPSINNVTLSGNKTASDLGLATPSDIVQSDWNEVDTGSKAYIDNKPTLGTAAAKDSTNAVTQSSTDLVESGAVYTELSGKVDTHSTDGVPDRLMTAAEGTKLSGVASGAQVNTIESISVNGSTVSPDANKNVAFTVMTNAVNDLVNYYLKSETYTKTEVDSLIAAVTSIDFKVVSQLPTTDISTTTIYLVPSDDPGTKNVKDEYICLDTTTTPATWELIGSTDIELSGYVTTSDLNTALADYVLTNTFNTHVATKGDSGVQGHVSLYQGDVSGKTYTSGEAAASAHTHDTRYAPYSIVADISGKADKVQNATNGHLAGLDGGGNITDSGVVANSVVTDVSDKTNLTVIAGVEATIIASKAYAVGDRLIYNGKLYKVTTAIAQGDTIVTSGTGQNVTETTVDAEIMSSSPSGKADKVSNATSGNFAGLDANGNLTDSGKKASDFTGKSFDGTSEEWAALSAAQKAEYTGFVTIKNDTANAMLVDSTPTENSNNLVKSGGVYTGLAAKVNTTTLADAFSTASTYSVGDVVIKDGELYKFITSHTAGAWNNAEVVVVTVDDIVKNAKQHIASDAKTFNSTGETYIHITLHDYIYNKMPTLLAFCVTYSGTEYYQKSCATGFINVLCDDGGVRNWDARFVAVNTFSGFSDLYLYASRSDTYGSDLHVIIKWYMSGSTYPWTVQVQSITEDIDMDVEFTRDTSTLPSLPSSSSYYNEHISGTQTFVNNTTLSDYFKKSGGTINGDVVIGQHYDSTQSQNVGSNLTVSGIVNANGSDYAEKFESIEDCPVGRFVTLDGEKIRLAQPEDDYILGVTSENPAIIGDKDNPGTPVGLVGKLWVESDGTCKVNGFAVSGANGIATDGGSTGYRVMAVEGNRVKILVK